MTIDLNSTRTKRDVFSAEIVTQLDAVVSPEARMALIKYTLDHLQPQSESDDRAGRSVSASNVGDECARRVQLGIWPTFHPNAPPIDKTPLTEKDRLVFARGHATETIVAGWLRRIFPLKTHRKNEAGEEWQYGFYAADGQIKGFADGVIGGPINALWEHKTLSQKGFSKFQRHGVLKSYPRYDAQVQMLMAYMDAPSTLFSVLNADTGELWFESHPLDPTRAQTVSDRAVHILKATRAGDLLPKAGDSENHFTCKFCRFRAECWRVGG